MTDYDKLSDRDLDAAVAKKVMGLDIVDALVALKNEKHYVRIPKDSDISPGRIGLIPHYSTDIAAAWEVVEKMATLPRAPGQYGGFQVNYDDHGWTAAFWKTYAFGKSPSHAICLAALKACKT